MAQFNRSGPEKKRTTTPVARPPAKPKKRASSPPRPATRPQPTAKGKRAKEKRNAPRPAQRHEAVASLNLLFGAVAAGGVGYGVFKHLEAEKHAAAAQRAAARADKALRNADASEIRTRKLAIEIAHTVNARIATLCREAVPQLRFDGCRAAATDGVQICIDMNWLLTEIVDPAVEPGSIMGRVAGALAHEWYHFLDTARGSRPAHEEELNADAFAGRQLARLCVPPDHFADLLGRFPQSVTHPAGALRVKKLLDAHWQEQQKIQS